MTAHLSTRGIETARELAQAFTATLRRQYSVVIEKTARELRGIPCLEPEEATPPKQEFSSSLSISHRIKNIEQLREAVAS